ncbi:MAG: hypothetical protein ACJZ9L_05645 [Coraliomargaritaceae bacterium]
MKPSDLFNVKDSADNSSYHYYANVPPVAYPEKLCASSVPI